MADKKEEKLKIQKQFTKYNVHVEKSHVKIQKYMLKIWKMCREKYNVQYKKTNLKYNFQLILALVPFKPLYPTHFSHLIVDGHLDKNRREWESFEREERWTQQK